jgi:hypothetical protein
MCTGSTQVTIYNSRLRFICPQIIVREFQCNNAGAVCVQIAKRRKPLGETR